MVNVAIDNTAYGGSPVQSNNIDPNVETGASPLSTAQNIISQISSIDPQVGQYVQQNIGATLGQFVSQNGYEAVTGLLQRILNAVQSGDYNALLGLNLNFGPNFEKYLDNRIAQQNTYQNQGWEEYMRDTSITSSAQQYQSVGLSASGVLQGGIAAHSGVQTADNSMTNLAQQNKLQKYAQNHALARSLISMAGSMANAGIYGGALNVAKNSAAQVAQTAAHSGLQALKRLDATDITKNGEIPSRKTNNAKGYLI